MATKYFFMGRGKRSESACAKHRRWHLQPTPFVVIESRNLYDHKTRYMIARANGIGETIVSRHRTLDKAKSQASALAEDWLLNTKEKIHDRPKRKTGTARRSARKTESPR